jgi:DNA-binding transcriptional ArsR family regulator
MKHIRSFNSFKENKNKKNNINEEFLGGLFKSLGNKISMGFSKMFGSASKVDKIMEEYKNEVMVAWTKKKDILLALGKLIKEEKNGGDVEPGKIEEIVKNLKVVSENYGKEKDLIKKKFDLKFNDAVKEEKNDKIKFYINIKKIEMEQELLKQESSALLTDAGLTEEDIQGNKEIEEILKGISDKTKQSEEMKTQEAESINSSDKDISEFDMEKAKTDSDYEWKDSKYLKEYNFETDEEIVYFSDKRSKEPKDSEKDSDGKYIGTVAYISSNQDDVEEGWVKVDYDKGGSKPFAIKKSKIISTLKDKEATAKKEEENKKEEESKPKEEI